MKRVKTALGAVFAQQKYWWIAGISGLLVFLLYFFLINKVTTISNIFVTSGAGYAITSIFMLVIISLLFGINVALFWYKKSANLNFGVKEGVGSTAGVLFGSVTAGCPVCGAFLLSIIGVAGGLAIFPLRGLEVQFFSAALLSTAFFWSSKSLTCDKCKVKR